MKKVLFVDDDEITQFLYKRLGANREILPFVAVNGKEALEIIGKEKIDYVFLDINMPIMDGIEFLEKHKLIAVEQQATNIYIMLGAEMSAGNAMLKDLGVREIINKPLKREVFTQLLHLD